MADEDKKTGNDLEAGLSDLEFDKQNKSDVDERSSGAADDEQTTDADESTDTDEALRKMQSERDKAIAERNKLQKRLEGSGEASKSSADDTEDGGSRSSEPDPWVAASKSNYRDQLYDSDPALSASGIDRSLIVGDTPDQMRTSFEGIQGTVRKMRGEITNQVLVDHGLAPVPGAGERREPINYKTMPTDQFNKEVEKALQG